MTLCGACAAFDIQSFKRAPYQTRGYELVDVKRRALEQTCNFCQFLHDIALGLEAESKASNTKQCRWIHLRMSENGTRREQSTSSPLRFNRMDVMLSHRHALFTSNASGRKAWEQEGVQCRVLADPGVFCRVGNKD